MVSTAIMEGRLRNLNCKNLWNTISVISKSSIGGFLSGRCWHLAEFSAPCCSKFRSCFSKMGTFSESELSNKSRISIPFACYINQTWDKNSSLSSINLKLNVLNLGPRVRSSFQLWWKSDHMRVYIQLKPNHLQNPRVLWPPHSLTSGFHEFPESLWLMGSTTVNLLGLF